MTAFSVSERDQFIAMLRGRAAIYEYFSMILAGPPEKQFLGLSGKFLPVFEGLGEAAAQGAEVLKKYAEKEADMNGQKVLDTLATNYTTFFYVGLGSVPSSESVFLSSARLVKQEPWEQVMAFYHIRKYVKPDNIREPEDHISVELHFMKFMCDLSLYMVEKGFEDKLAPALKEQKTFLDEHLLKWTPDFCGNVLAMGKYDELGLYSAVAHLLPVFLENDRAGLTELII